MPGLAPPTLIGQSIFHGTALDTSLLIDHIGSYIFHGADGPKIEQNLVLGISLGGHAAWQVFFNDPRVTAAIVIIGCPDYMRKAQSESLDLPVFERLAFFGCLVEPVLDILR
jgi:pimeloyl-ACP methyl ester carboxylesterase